MRGTIKECGLFQHGEIRPTLRPYPEAELDKVTYLVYDTANTLIASGVASAAGEGRYQATLTTDITSELLPGASKIEFIAISKQVSLPTFAEKQFLAVEP